MCDGQPQARGVGAGGAHVGFDCPQSVRVQTRIGVHDEQPRCPEQARTGVHLTRAPRAAPHDPGTGAPGRLHGFVTRASVDHQHLMAEVELCEIPEQVGKGLGLVESRDDDPEFRGVHGRGVAGGV